MPYRAVLFDLDGTLLDTLDDLVDSANAALHSLGFPPHSREAYKHFIGDGIENLVRRVLPAEARTAETIARGLALARAEYAQRWADKTKPYPGIPELLDGLCACGVALAVLSNKPDEFTRLCVTKLLPRWHFDPIQGAVATLPKKPNPAGALAVAARLCVPPAQVLYLGDTNTDMQTAVAAGMFPVGAVWGFRDEEELSASGAVVLAWTPTEVLRLLDGST